MRRSLVPAGFEAVAHGIFFDYSPPLSNSRTLIDKESNEVCVDEVVGGSGVLRVCPICLQPFDKPSLLIKCQHIFCMDCILHWFKTRVECPLCKVSSGYFLQANLSGYEKGALKLWKVLDEGDDSPDTILSDVDCRRAVFKLRECLNTPPVVEHGVCYTDLKRNSDDEEGESGGKTLSVTSSERLTAFSNTSGSNTSPSLGEIPENIESELKEIDYELSRMYKELAEFPATGNRK